MRPLSSLSRLSRLFLLLLALSCSRLAIAQDNYQAIIDRAVAADGFNGVALVGVGAKVVALQARGVADAEARVAMAPDSLFEVGSISKRVAAIVVLRLVDQGTLDLDAPITRYLPDYRADSGAKLTLRTLMSHSSGVPNDINAARQRDPAIRGVELDPMEAVRRYASGDLAFEPGTAWDYSHSNWILVKAVVERATGRDYARLVDDLLVRPLGLKHSGVLPGAAIKPAHLAASYAALAPAPVVKESLMPRYMAMAGGFYTSAGDLLQLMDAVFGSDRVLQPASRRALTTVSMPRQHYALGGRTRTVLIAGREREAVWDDGSNAGYRTVARRVAEDGHTVIVMTNASFDHQALGRLADALMEASYDPTP